MYELIITEKPKAAERVANALADNKPTKNTYKKITFYELKHDKKDIVVTAAVGHLYGLKQTAKEKSYPQFEIAWQPAHEIRKESKFTKPYLDLIKKLAKKADEYTVATDYDVEGEVIGLNIVRYTCEQKDAQRMKFSTLTKQDIKEAYEQKEKTLNWGQAKAGETRHFLDWYYGINISRALTSAIKKSGMFKILSSGRVQSPALKMIVDKEKEIKAFKSEPFWQIELTGKINKEGITALHAEDKIFDKKRADEIIKKTKNKEAVVKEVTKKENIQQPPHPFDLTSLQIEAHGTLRFSPKRTLSIAQELYTSGLISYPRTSSQKLPKKLGYNKIIKKLERQSKFKELSKELQSKKTLTPNEGKKTDPAHPAIYPTGNKPKSLKPEEEDLYELITRRFLATFAEEAVRESLKVTIECNKEEFLARGTTTKTPGWHRFYGRFLRLKDEELPKTEKGDSVKNNKTKKLEKETQPPKRYTEASLIKELEKRDLGTKATRAEIIDKLFRRGYIEDKTMEASDLGIAIADTLSKYSPKIVDEEMTRHFETEMEDIRESKRKEEDVLEEARQVLTKVLKGFKDKEKNIGDSLIEATKKFIEKTTTVGLCPKCKKGKLSIRRGKFGRFIACDQHPDCKTTFSLPAAGTIKVSEKICEHCEYPIITIFKKRGKQEVCINKDCPAKQVAEKDVEKKKCSKCGAEMVLRKSVYGSFYGCEKYPKCRNTEKIEQ